MSRSLVYRTFVNNFTMGLEDIYGLALEDLEPEWRASLEESNR